MPQLGHPGRVGERLFEVVERDARDALSERDRLVPRPGAVGVQPERDGRRQRVAHGPDRLYVVRDRLAAHLELDRPVARLGEPAGRVDGRLAGHHQPVEREPDLGVRVEHLGERPAHVLRRQVGQGQVEREPDRRGQARGVERGGQAPAGHHPPGGHRAADERGAERAQRGLGLRQRLAAEAGQRRGVSPPDPARVVAQAEQDALAVVPALAVPHDGLGQWEPIRQQVGSVDPHGGPRSSTQPRANATE